MISGGSGVAEAVKLTKRYRLHFSFEVTFISLFSFQLFYFLESRSPNQTVPIAAFL